VDDPVLRKSVYDDPEIYAKSSDHFHKKCEDATLVIVGDSDGECPTPQSYEFWHALNTRRRDQLVVYDTRRASLASPAHQRDRIRRTLPGSTRISR